VENSTSQKRAACTSGILMKEKMGRSVMMDIRNLARTLKAARLKHEGRGTEGSKLLKYLGDQDLRDAARFVENYPLLAEMIMRRDAQAGDTPPGEI
jgi:hypothetical protein